jgi:hypothetical protein
MHVNELHDSAAQLHRVLEYLLLGLHSVIRVLGVLVDLVQLGHLKASDRGRLRLESAQNGHALLRFGVVSVVAAHGQGI